MPDKETPPVRESGLKTYLHLAAYRLPALAFVIFSTVVVLPRVVAVWKHAGIQVKDAEWWILGLCEIFTFNFNYFLGGAVIVFIVLEKGWARWPSIRSRVVRTFTWILTMLVLAGITWTSVTALLVVPMVLNQHKKAEAKAGAAP
ncbi:MAG TPA: hypothetical protein PLB55_13945 [Prosthecobacter sp.]|nr:hypothetical protein [Prosthecobacter sp.]